MAILVGYEDATIELPDDLLIAAKRRAAETRTTLKSIFERALRRELVEPRIAERPPRGRSDG